MAVRRAPLLSPSLVASDALLLLACMLRGLSRLTPFHFRVRGSALRVFLYYHDASIPRDELQHSSDPTLDLAWDIIPCSVRRGSTEEAKVPIHMKAGLASERYMIDIPVVSASRTMPTAGRYERFPEISPLCRSPPLLKASGVSTLPTPGTRRRGLAATPP